FQAEDGIRDRNVTGVQTCALPIWTQTPPSETSTSEEESPSKFTANPVITSAMTASTAVDTAPERRRRRLTPAVTDIARTPNEVRRNLGPRALRPLLLPCDSPRGRPLRARLLQGTGRGFRLPRARGHIEIKVRAGLCGTAARRPGRAALSGGARPGPG